MPVPSARPDQNPKEIASQSGPGGPWSTGARWRVLAAHSARKTKHKTPQLLCSSSAVFSRRRAKSPFGFACGGQRGPTWSSPTSHIPGTWDLAACLVHALVYGPPRPQNPVPWFAADGAIRRIRRGWAFHPSSAVRRRGRAPERAHDARRARWRDVTRGAVHAARRGESARARALCESAAALTRTCALALWLALARARARVRVRALAGALPPISVFRWGMSGGAAGSGRRSGFALLACLVLGAWVFLVPWCA